MSIPISTIKQELRELAEEKKGIDKKVKALQELLATYKNDKFGTQENIPSARGGFDIRPHITAVFENNGNQPMQMKEIISQVAKLAPEIPEITIRKKMIYAVRESVGLLEKKEYGKYSLKK